MDSAITTNATSSSGLDRKPATALVVMGVAGCGKSSVGEACAERLGWRLVEGDDFHSADAILKMRSGMPLTDADREGWLDRLGSLLQLELMHRDGKKPGVVLTCSALRKAYRDRLRAAVPGLRFAFLQIQQSAAEARVAARTDHLFPASLVASQFATLESPSGEAGVLTLDATASIAMLAQQVEAWLAPAAEGPSTQTKKNGDKNE